jgi:hypothetical protein
MPLTGRRMLLTMLRTGSVAALVAVSLSSVPATMIAAAPIGPETVVIARSPFGFQLLTSWPDTTVTGIEIISVTAPTPITLGVFGINGHVVGGDAVLAGFLDLGTAPVPKVVLPATNLSDYIFVTPTSPVAGGVTNTAGFLLQDLPGFGNGFPPGSGVLGAEGTMYVGLALLTEVNQPLSDVLGVRVPFQVRIGDTSGFLNGPDGNAFLFSNMSIGGAADFAPIPEPTTLLLFGTTAAGLGLNRWKQRRRKRQP